MTRFGLVLLLLTGCPETTLKPFKPPIPVDPPDLESDIFGEPPSDWENCYNGFLGLYSNLPNDHVDIEPVELEPVSIETLDWWSPEYRAFQRYDGSLDFGPNWWPVDSGLVDDPSYFGVRWVGWMRVTKKADHDFVIGASTDAWMLLNDELLVAIEGNDSFETHTYTHEIKPGKYKVDIRYAHRFGAENGFRFRAHSEHLVLCYPDYSTQSSSGP